VLAWFSTTVTSYGGVILAGFSAVMVPRTKPLPTMMSRIPFARSFMTRSG